MLKKSLKFFLFTLMLVAAVSMFGCGSDGDTGPQGPKGDKGDKGDPGTPASAVIEPETCTICHSSVDQTEHQSIYSMYNDPSALTLTIDDVTSIAGAAEGTFDTTVTFTVKKNGVGLSIDQVEALPQFRFLTVPYENGEFGSEALGVVEDIEFDDTTLAAGTGDGQFTISVAGIPFAPEDAAGSAQVYGYVADDPLEVEELPPGTHVALYDNVANAAKAFGGLATTPYVSPANVNGCIKCHGTPYMKHGYREAVVENLGDFSACKSCHLDTREGHAWTWQILVTDPARFAEIEEGSAVTDAEKITYAYKASVKNDVHMSHSMEFGYPQSMQNCATCHFNDADGTLNEDILQDENFTIETCKSCHPVETNEYEAAGKPNPIHGEAAPSLRSLWAKVAGHPTDPNTNCEACHSEGSDFNAPRFGVLMPGYNPMIYDVDTGTKYSEIFTATIDTAALDGNTLSVSFHVDEAADNPTTWSKTDIVPNLLVGLYGYETKDFIVSPHSSFDDGTRYLEGDISEPLDNPRFTIVSAPGDGTWKVDVDLSAWADMIDDGIINKAQIGVRPALRDPAAPFGIEERSGLPYPFALNAVSRTFDFLKPGFDDTFFGNNIADVQGCNKCHDALATSFHTADRGGDIPLCRLCHWSGTGGSHLEMQSRAIDSYAHAIHSFQGFDIKDVDFADQIARVSWAVETEHFFPNFTLKNCEACHTPGKYAVPDDFSSLSAVLSASSTLKGKVRNINEVPSYITGPGYRSCGGCHRASAIKEDDAGKLSSLNQHASQMGYLVEPDEENNITWETIIETIQAFF